VRAVDEGCPESTRPVGDTEDDGALVSEQPVTRITTAAAAIERIVPGRLPRRFTGNAVTRAAHLLSMGSPSRNWMLASNCWKVLNTTACSALAALGAHGFAR
jgi:hypothetical protein